MIKTNNSKETIRAIQQNLNTVLKKLSEYVDFRAVRNIGKAIIGIINARSTRISEITHKSKRKCKRLITGTKRNYRMLTSKNWGENR